MDSQPGDRRNDNQEQEVILLNEESLEHLLTGDLPVCYDTFMPHLLPRPAFEFPQSDDDIWGNFMLGFTDSTGPYATNGPDFGLPFFEPTVGIASASGQQEPPEIANFDLSPTLFAPSDASVSAYDSNPGLEWDTGQSQQLTPKSMLPAIEEDTSSMWPTASRTVKPLPTLAPRPGPKPGTGAGVQHRLVGLKPKVPRRRTDPADPGGPCLPCKLSRPTMSRLPCLRYKISDSILNRTGLDHMAFYRAHPMVGPRYGDFSKVKNWAEEKVYSLDITQDCGPVCHLQVRRFIPPVDPQALDLKGRPMYNIPFGILDADEATKAVNTYLDESVEAYMDCLLDDTDHVVFDVFHVALRMSVFPEPDNLLRSVLRLWTACRFIEGRWRCCGEYNIDAERLRNPFRPDDWISPPPYIDYQLGSIIIQRILSPLRHSVLKDLQSTVYANKPQNWFRIFLTVFILLQNYEMGVTFQQAFALKRKSGVLYLDMPLIRGIHSGAKTILAHFHYVCKGQLPFSDNFDWASPVLRKMAALDKEQIDFLQRLRTRIRAESFYIQSVNRTDKYSARLWFISQLFEQEWTPRITLEHAPEVSTLLERSSTA
ncbi:hypothetical protein GQ53DRAFT_811092 [Thozetella sp. PMI_491]|nr:hypothetical protein GQ53DRAFT_811092 [Thozetella sp. PMI_491]